jgi:subtilisin family serine protease
MAIAGLGAFLDLCAPRDLEKRWGRRAGRDTMGLHGLAAEMGVVTWGTPGDSRDQRRSTRAAERRSGAEERRSMLSRFHRCVLGLAGVLLAASAPAQPPAAERVGPPASKVHAILRQRLSEADKPVKAWVFFADKGIASDAEYQAALRTVAANYDPRAAQRRMLRGPGARGGELFDQHDLPVVPEYVRAVTATGAHLHITSRWLNAISVYLTPDQAEAIAKLPIVDRLEAVAGERRIAPVEAAPAEPEPHGRDRIDYGVSTAQLQQITLPPLHDAGYTGKGVVIGICDTGFRTDHEAFNQPGHVVKIIAAYDFLDNDPVVEPEPGDYPDQHAHGTLVLGCIAAYLPGHIVGGAFDAEFILCKTVDLLQEVPAEEDNFVAGLEFIEANGADVSNASLGFTAWYTQSQLDGQTAAATIAVNILTGLGVHHCNAAGNDSHDSDPATSHLIAPADAFQSITVGAVDTTGAIGSFSSDGPTADGRVKPEVVACGVSTISVDPYATRGYKSGTGTSLATPLVASTVACLVQARPRWIVDQMRQRLFETGDYYQQYQTFDPLYIRGYGVIDAFAPIGQPFPLRISLPGGVPTLLPPGETTTLSVQIEDGCEAYVPGSGALRYRYDGGVFHALPLSALGGDLFEAALPSPACGDLPEFYFIAAGSGGSVVYLPEGGAATPLLAHVGAPTVIIDDNFESDLGWTVINDPTLLDGAWQCGVPILPAASAPPADFDGSGQCYLTDNTPGNSDVDGGPTRLVSPMFDLSAMSDVTLRYARWWANDDQDSDPFDVEVSNDGGATWALIERVVNVPPGWVEREVRLDDYTSLTRAVVVRFSAMDRPNNSVDEGGVDAVRIMGISCTGGTAAGDLNCDGVVNLADVSHFAQALADPAGYEADHDGSPHAHCNRPLADMNDDGEIDGLDVAGFVEVLISG